MTFKIEVRSINHAQGATNVISWNALHNAPSAFASVQEAREFLAKRTRNHVKRATYRIVEVV